MKITGFKIDHVLLFAAFLATLVVYAILALKDKDISAMRDIMLALAGALAGVSIPRGSGPSE